MCAAHNSTAKTIGDAGVIIPAPMFIRILKAIILHCARAALVDFSPLFKYGIQGPQAGAYLMRVLSLNMLPPAGRAARVMVCDDDGFLLADGILHHMWTDEYRLTLEVSLMSWLADSLSGFDAVLSDITTHTGILALAGPSACAILSAAGFTGIETARLFDIRSFNISDMALNVVRTAPFGGVGYEIWVEERQALVLWDRLMRAGGVFGLSQAGLIAMDVCRLEYANARANRDYANPEISPAQDRPLLPPNALSYGRFRHVVPGGNINNEWRLVGASCTEPGMHALIGLEMNGKQTGLITSQLYSPGLGVMMAHIILPASLPLAAQAHFITAGKNAQELKHLGVKWHDGPFLADAEHAHASL